MINVWASVTVATIDAVKAETAKLSVEVASLEESKGEKVEKESISKEKVIALTAIPIDAEYRKVPALKGEAHKLLDLYYPDEEADQRIAELQKDPSITILGAWDWEGNAVLPVDKEACKAFMPARYDEEGNEVEDDTVRDVVLMYGQSPRDFT